ncbi:sporulation integral membrane protein YtvI [Gracilibacillus ureilyticus]|uniref:Sporulation integral membrane protein YtvI n=1 Tax=Gracilibacillus ureilyticus TaxID=531814 RepID=A0A1H9UDH4_9BACI|nr:sporulation integral membrane protein YtvI [Gracilibacillus ureilyticus]SES07620.1 sporulation integral membrane protein YtvI [Gracilibacillus ureilyticus]
MNFSKETIIRFTVLLAIFITFFLLIYTSVQFLFPFLLACFFSLLLYPFIQLVKSTFHFNHTAACVTVLLFTICSIVLLFAFIVFEIIDGIIYLAKWLPGPFQAFLVELSGKINDWLLPLLNKMNSYMDSLTPEQNALMKEQLDEISISFADQFAAFLEKLLSSIGEQLTALPGTMTIIIFSLLCTFFICKDWPKFTLWAKSRMGSSVYLLPLKIYDQLKITLLKYIKAQFLLVSISFITILIGLMLLRMEHALTISVIISALDLLPILGTGVVFIPWAFYLFLSGQDILALFLAGLYLLIIIQRQILEPKLISDALGIHPLLTILAVYLGYQLFGMNGLWAGPLILFLGNATHQAKLFLTVIHFLKTGKVNVDKS